jgi:hypothetical protein
MLKLTRYEFRETLSLWEQSYLNPSTILCAHPFYSDQTSLHDPSAVYTPSPGPVQPDRPRPGPTKGSKSQLPAEHTSLLNPSTYHFPACLPLFTTIGAECQPVYVASFHAKCYSP